jgi:hypothetical protein
MMSEPYLTRGILEIIGWLRNKPIEDVLSKHLLTLFGKDGEVAQIAEEQEAIWVACPQNDGKQCHDHSCGICEPYRPGPLLDEVLAEIKAFEFGSLEVDEKGGLVRKDPEELPF